MVPAEAGKVAPASIPATLAGYFSMNMVFRGFPAPLCGGKCCLKSTGLMAANQYLLTYVYEFKSLIFLVGWSHLPKEVLVVL